MNQEEKLSIFQDLTLTKEEIVSKVNVWAGKISKDNAIQVIAELKVLEEIIKEAKAKIREIVNEAMEDVEDKTFYKGSAKFTKTNTVNYSYDHCELWQYYKGKVDHYTEKLKELQETMKTITSPIIMEGMDVEPAKKEEKSNFRVGLK